MRQSHNHLYKNAEVSIKVVNNGYVATSGRCTVVFLTFQGVCEFLAKQVGILHQDNELELIKERVGAVND